MSPAALIAIVVVGVLLLGAGVFLVGRAMSGSATEVPLAEEQIVEENPEIVTPIPDAPEPVVEPIPDEPSLEPLPAEPSVESMPAEPSIESMPAEPLDPATAEEAGGQQPATETIEVGAGISAAVPAGWSAEAIDDATVSMGVDGGGAVLGIYTAPVGSTGAELVSFYVQETLSVEMTDLEVTQPEALALDVPTITTAAVNAYRGTYVSQQGSFPLEGGIWAFIRADGTALVVDSYWAPGVDIEDDLTNIIVSALNTM